MKRWITGMFLTGFLVGQASGQQLLLPPAPAMPKELPMASALYDAEQLAASRSWTVAELEEQLALVGIPLADEGLVHANIMGPEGSAAVSEAFITSFGGRADSGWRYSRDAWVPIGELTRLARALPQGYFLDRAHYGEVDDVAGEGPLVINSDSYRDGGADGSGLTVAIIDRGFENLTAAQQNGDIPGSYHYVNYTPHPLESVTPHGTGCVEAFYDHSPGATYRLYMTDTDTDLGLAVEDALSHGVDVISLSLAWRISGWSDNSGIPCAAANLAALNGVLVFVAAGNYAECHYQGTFSPGSGGTDWHDFAPGDETVNIVIDDGATVSFAMQWNTAGGTYDYDLYLFDSGMNQIGSSTNPGNYFEAIIWTNNTGADQTVHLAVYRYSGGITELEIATHYGEWQEHQIAWSSTTSPSNCTHPFVISVGAVDWNDFTAPGGTYGIIMDYSSRGPSNSGMTLPDICGPTNTTGFTYPNGMGGTSCATPNCAGAAGAFCSADALLHPDGVRWLIQEQAAQWRDWGQAGQDNTYGVGGMVLYDYAPSTLWVARAYGNTADLRAYPLYTLQGANDWAENGGRLLLFPGGNYPEPATLDRAVTVETTEYTAILGE